MNSINLLQHLSWRAGFGPAVEDLSVFRSAGLKTYTDALFQASSKAPSMLESVGNPFNGLKEGIDMIQQLQDSTEEEKKKRREQNREGIRSLNQQWLAEMIGTTRSRVSFFMNKFRKLGFIKYNGKLHVHSSLLT